METFYHGSSSKFHQFDISHALEGDGKTKHGAGFYLTTGYRRAAHYSCKRPGSTDFYVYTVEIPDLTPDNFIEFDEPVSPSIVQRAEKELDVTIPPKELVKGNFFRKYIARKLACKKNSQKLTQEDENAAADFLVKIGVIYNKVPFIWHPKPVVNYDVIVMKPDVINILKIEKVDLAIDKKTKKLELVEGSQVEVPLDNF